MTSLPTWILGGFLLLLTVFVGTTYRSGWEVGFAFVMAATVVMIRLQFPPPKSHSLGTPFDWSGWPGSTTAGSKAGVGMGRRTGAAASRWLLPFAVWISFAAALLATYSWRAGARSEDQIVVTIWLVDPIAHMGLFASLIVWILAYLRGHVSLLPLGLGVLLCCLAGGGGGTVLASHAVIAMAGAIGFLIVSQIVLRQIWTEDSGEPEPRSGTGSGWLFGGGTNDIIAGLVISAVLISTSVITRATSNALPQVQRQVVKYVAKSMERAEPSRRAAGGRYVSGSRFGTVRSQMMTASEELALRGYSESAPGYLRGSVFGRYDARRWINLDAPDRPTSRRRASVEWLQPVGPGTTRLTGDGRTRLRRFRLAANTIEPSSTVEIHGDPSKGPIVFVPLAARWIEAAAIGLEVSEDTIVISGVDIDSPYVLGVTQSVPTQPLSGDREEQLLWVPPVLQPITGMLADQLCTPGTSVGEQAESVARYFQDNFEYSLFHFIHPGNRDPIEHFLLEQHPAHCEYFATATAMILRQAGVPTRYVTGYVMAERDERDGSWIARNMNAHAWVEAYDAAAEHWFPVESTPGRQYQTLKVDAERDGLAAAHLAAVQGGESDLAWYTRLWRWVIGIRITDGLVMLFRVARLPLFLFLLFVLWFKIRRGSVAGLDPIDRRSLGLLRRVDRDVRRQALIRAAGETLHQFADRIEAKARSCDDRRSEVTLRRAAEWYREYATARYRGLEPRPMEAAISRQSIPV